jgi:aminopeptidase
MSDIILEKWVDILLDFSLRVDFAKAWKNGHKRLWLRFQPPADALAKVIVEKVYEKGGNVFIDQRPPWHEYDFCTKTSDEVLSSKPVLEIKRINYTAAYLRLLSESNTRSLATVDPARIAMRDKANLPWVEKMLKVDKEGNFCTPWCSTLFPTSSYAQDLGMSLDEFREYAFEAMLLNERDPKKAWAAMSDKANKLKREVLDSARTIRIVDKEDGTDLKMSVGGHRWLAADGRVNFPDGEIFNAPRKDSANGVITFPRLPQHYRGTGPEVSGIRYAFKNGKLVKWKAEVGQDYLDKFFEKQENSRFLGEIALGLHPKIQNISRQILYDEKIGGSVHIAFGRAYHLHVLGNGDRSQLNRSPVHWDQIRDMRVPTASVIINDKHELKWDSSTKCWLVQKL